MNYNFCKELKEAFNRDVFDKMSIVYQLNGFVEACKMELEEGYEKKGDPLSNIVVKDANNYHMQISFCEKSKKLDYILIGGTYDDFRFDFYSFFNPRRVGQNTISNMPFTIYIEKTEDVNNYYLSIDCKYYETKIAIGRKNLKNELDNDSVVFYNRREDSENSFALVNAFLCNPNRVLAMYSRIFGNKKVYFSNKEVDSAKYNDEFLIDEKGKLLEKVLK